MGKDKNCDCDRSKCLHLNRCLHIEKLKVDCEISTGSLDCYKEAKVGCLRCHGEAKVRSLDCCGEAHVNCLECCEKAKVGCLECCGKAKVGELECCGSAQIKHIEASDIKCKNLDCSESARVDSLECSEEAIVGSLRSLGEATAKSVDVCEDVIARELLVTNTANIGTLNVNGNATFGDLFYPGAWGQMKDNGVVSTTFGIAANPTPYMVVPVSAVLGDATMQSFVVVQPNRLVYTGIPTRMIETSASVTITHSSGTGPTTFNLGLGLNGSLTPIDGTVVGLTVDSTFITNSTNINKIVKMSTGDYLQLLVQRVTTGSTEEITTTFNLSAVALPNLVV
jgi:hypothetical protein